MVDQLHNLLRERGVPVPVSQFRPWWAPSQRIDGAYFNEKILLELDGRRFHARVEAFEADRTRDFRSATRGWLTLRITWLQLTRDPELVIAMLRKTLATRSREAA